MVPGRRREGLERTAAAAAAAAASTGARRPRGCGRGALAQVEHLRPRLGVLRVGVAAAQVRGVDGWGEHSPAAERLGPAAIVNGPAAAATATATDTAARLVSVLGLVVREGAVGHERLRLRLQHRQSAWHGRRRRQGRVGRRATAQIERHAR